MKARVIKSFRDKHTNEIRRKGQEIEVTQERYEELTSVALGPFVEVLEPMEQAKKPEKKPAEKPEKKSEKTQKTKTIKAKK